MGRIKTTMIKRNAQKLYRNHSKEFKKDFNENKKVIEQFADIKSKKIRNIMAGYLTKLTKKPE